MNGVLGEVGPIGDLQLYSGRRTITVTFSSSINPGTYAAMSGYDMLSGTTLFSPPIVIYGIEQFNPGNAVLPIVEYTVTSVYMPGSTLFIGFIGVFNSSGSLIPAPEYVITYGYLG